MSYATDHAGALADVSAAGAAITFTASSVGAYNPLTDSFGTANPSSVSGYAIRVQGNPRIYEALGLVESENPSLFFTPSTYGAVPALGATCTWGGRTWTVKNVAPFEPDGVSIFSEIIVGGGVILILSATGSLTQTAGAIAGVATDPLATLRTALGDANLVGIWWGLSAVTAAGGVASQIDDPRNAGFGPSLTASGTGKPGYSAATGLFTFDGVDDNAKGVNGAIASITGNCGVFIVTTIPTTGAAQKALFELSLSTTTIVLGCRKATDGTVMAIGTSMNSAVIAGAGLTGLRVIHVRRTSAAGAVTLGIQAGAGTEVTSTTTIGDTAPDNLVVAANRNLGAQADESVACIGLYKGDYSGKQAAVNQFATAAFSGVTL